MTTNLQKVFEERILNSRVGLTLQELLGIAKPEFHAKFSNIVKRKWKILVVENPSKAQHIEAVARRWSIEWIEEEPRTMVESKVNQVHFNDEAQKFISRGYFSRAHWARAITKIMVRIGDFDELMVALVDSSFEIDIMSLVFERQLAY
ncbi:hypothetical protein L7F22_008063 [Adiantum nelumboides]|nr:hypothetical protein [Adiantum nelumboides]